MAEVDDGYETYYAERLWQALPALYRSADTDSLGAPGPLRELLDRIGAQVAVVRRSIDGLWADQSIETCQDWVIPYLGDLLGTNLVNQLDAAAQRLDVAKTIHYRRRKGTVEVLEELARDVTGWSAHVVEGFRRLARSRHGLDPAVGPGAYPGSGPAEVATLLGAQGLIGRLTGTPAGGLADLRSAHGALLAGTAFDESFHTADLRAGRGAFGHFGIPKLMVFLWRLTSFAVVGGTPVAVAGCDGQYVFDPTGRQVPLFLPSPPAAADFSETWSPAHEWQVPGPLTASLEAAVTDTGASPPPPLRRGYPDAVAPRYGLKGEAALARVWPELGRFATTGAGPEPLTVDYHYGFSSMVGAGPYDRDLLGDPPPAVGAETVVTGGTGLGTALGAAGAAPSGATVTLGDSLTYTAIGGAGSTTAPIVSLLVRAGPSQRPVLRPPVGSGPWVFTGGGQAELVLDGLTVSGCDVVLRGSFASVRITACTFDPGAASPGAGGSGPSPLAVAADGSGPSPLAVAADGKLLAPCRIFVEADPDAASGGTIARLVVDRSILGPLRSRLGGSVETVTISDSIVQGLPATVGATYTADDVFDPSLLARALIADDPVARALLAAMPAAAGAALEAYAAEPLATQAAGVPAEVIDGLNALVTGPSLFVAATFAGVDLSPGVAALAAGAASLDGSQLAQLNRGLIDEVFPVALGTAALAIADAAVNLHRVSVLGRIAAHRLSAGDSILWDFVAVDDAQEGCVRFCAYAAGSFLPRQYESAALGAAAPLFVSTSYGQPGFAQLIETADAAIVGGATGASVLNGAETGSEMGAFSADLNPVKEQGLLVKYAEYLPLGLTPVLVHVT